MGMGGRKREAASDGTPSAFILTPLRPESKLTLLVDLGAC